MDKEAALLVVAKDLFLEGLKLMPALKKSHEAKGKELEHIADEFAAFLKRLQAGIG